MSRKQRFKSKRMLTLLTLGSSIASFVPALAQQQHPSWIDSAVVYCVYPEIFSSNGLQGVQAQLSRLQGLSVNVSWLMPVTPVGQPIGNHPAFDSPYAVHDFYAVNPKYGPGADLTNLVTAAHNLGMKVILEEVLNRTAWDNTLTTQHPEYYRQRRECLQRELGGGCL